MTADNFVVAAARSCVQIGGALDETKTSIGGDAEPTDVCSGTTAVAAAVTVVRIPPAAEDVWSGTDIFAPEFALLDNLVVAEDLNDIHAVVPEFDLDANLVVVVDFIK
jgi:hypothetical protein